MEITNDFTTRIMPDFWVGEFWKNVDFDMPYPLAKGAQIIREFFNIPMTITNTYPDGQIFGYHRLKKAIDITAANVSLRQQIIDKYNAELDNYINGKGSVLIDNLRAAGITGFGRENVCIHIDVRPEGIDPEYGTSCNRSDKYGKYTAFSFICHYENGKMIIDENKAI